ncbi:MAG: NUDIX domain-containing protein [Treponema sp.]|jgi:8-oxo-dGTP pyrophosphatase MutT (NUDIX family)|nr:NUDIX domain-containing protein [Treponema sp.]
MFNFCPSCASKKITFNEGKVFRCPDCAFVYYHNIAAATGCLISVPFNDSGQKGERILFTVRNNEPSAGLLDLPGGFVDIGEGVLEGLYRELQEELGWAPPIPAGENLTSILKLYASFHNVYNYKGIDYNTCDMYFSVSAPGLSLQDLCLEQSEIADVRFLRPEEIDFDQLAFISTKRAVKAYLGV